MEESELKEILERYRAGKSTPEDMAFLESWYLSHNKTSPYQINDEERVEDMDSVWSFIQPQQVSSRVNLWYRVSAAAAILIFFSIGSYFLIKHNNQSATNTIVENDAPPGTNKATLILADGKRLILGDAASGQLANQAGVIITKTSKGELVYTIGATNSKAQSAKQFNELETARGEQYQVVLPDGSHVWLNAASSLKYPVAFSGNERVVELTGEAYFEVAHNKAMPFKVKTLQQEVEVLGTHFNVSAYSDEKLTATTLMQGSVRVTSAADHKNTIIKPGQQSVISATVMQLREVDTDEAIAWKNGYFEFNDENLESIMRKVSRWYNVEVVYRNDAARSMVFSGTVSKYKNVSQVIRILELTNAVHFKIDKNKIVINN
jgi:ferric-dicitrate binding protein FerR (iron transport regulator)